MAVAKPKFEEIAALANAELHTPRSSELSLRRIEREIQGLRSSPDSESRNHGLLLSAVIEALRFDVPAARQRFEQALAATGHHSNAYVNYGVALAALGLFREAFEKIEIAVQKAPEIDTLRLALEFASHALNVEKIEHYAAWLDRLKALDDNARKALNNASWQVAVVNAAGVDRQRLFERYEAARGVARAHKLRIPDERATISSRGILVEWAAYCDADEVAQMNFEAAEAMSAVAADPSEMLVSFGYAQASFIKQAA
jgi:tetratricopeptide (TPR) repeat protein